MSVILCLFKSSKELTSIIRSGKDRNSGYPIANTVWVEADHERDFHPLANHIINKKNSPRRIIVIFQHFDFHFIEQALSNLIVCLMISQKQCTKIA